MAKVATVTSRVVIVYVDDVEVGGRVDAHELNWRVLDVQALDGGLLQGVGVEELGLGLSRVGALAIPPLGTVAVNDVARGTSDSDVGSRYRDEWAFPLLVAKGSGTLEDDLAWRTKCQRKEPRASNDGIRHTLVPDLRLVRSSVVPAGTAMLFRVMVEQEALPLMAAAASVKVQAASRLTSAGAAWIMGSRAARATTGSMIADVGVGHGGGMIEQWKLKDSE